MSPKVRRFEAFFAGFASLGGLPACGGEATTSSTSSGSGGAGGGATTGTTAASSSTGSGPTCPGVGDPCTTCESASCPKAYCDCYNDPECVLMAQCLAKCAIGDEACSQPCWTAHPSAISVGALLYDCAGTVCTKGCPGYPPLGECLVCVYTRCQPEMNACISKPECTKLLDCVAACATPMCETSCYQMFPGGSAEAGPVANCLQAQCPTECAP